MHVIKPLTTVDSKSSAPVQNTERLCRLLLPNTNTMQAKLIVFNFLVATLEKVKRKMDDINFNNLFNPLNPNYYISTCKNCSLAI